MKHILFIFIGSLLFLGCSSTVAPMTEYKLNPHMPKQELASSTCQNKILKVQNSFANAKYVSLDMRYVIGDSKEYAYSESRWSNPLSRSVSDELVRLVRSSGLFQTVVSAKSRAKSNYVLESTIEDFVQYYDEVGENSHVNIRLSLVLLDATNNTIIASKVFEIKREVSSLDAEGGTDALNSAFSEVLEQNSVWLERVCQ
jgi:ABC-type uncharacterized transport system auxiliary subunit